MERARGRNARVTPVVTHVTVAWLQRSEAWLYDVVTLPLPYEARILTGWRENEEEFPFEPVEVLTQSRLGRSLPWLHSQCHRRLGWPRTPGNPWSRSLRRLAGAAPSLFHAHYGFAGSRAVNAGLSPVLTSFYGGDASHKDILDEWRVAYRRLFRRGAAFVAEGPAMRERLIELGAPPERTHVVPLIAPLLDEWKPAVLRDGETPVVLMAGRLVEKKGFVDGVTAFAEVRRAGLEARLRIIGSGPEDARLQDAVRRYRIEDEVEFLPAQPRDRFREVLSSSHVLLQPSRTASNGDAEGGAPTTLLEGQALGRVVVATDHADIPHIVDPDAAYLSGEGDINELAANLIRVLSEPGEWASRAADGRRFVERNHSRERVAGLLERLYDEVADAR